MLRPILRASVYAQVNIFMHMFVLRLVFVVVCQCGASYLCPDAYVEVHLSVQLTLLGTTSVGRCIC